MGSRLAFVLREALRGLSRARLVNLLAVGTMAMALFILGLFLVATAGLQALAGELRSRLDLEVFLQEGLSAEETQALRDNLAGLPGVNEVTFISKSEALAQFQAIYGDSLLTALPGNPLPASFRIRLHEDVTGVAQITALAQHILGLWGVDEVEYGADWLGKLDRLLGGFYLVDLTFGMAITVGTALIIANTVRLTIFARREEIEIMQLVGATDRFIRTPFMIEGALQGLVAGGVAAGLAYLGVDLIAKAIQSGSPFLAGRLHFPFLVAWLLMLFGGVIGALGSWLAVHRFIRF